MKRDNLYRVFKPSARDPRRSRVFVVISRQVLIDSWFSTIICAPIYSAYDGLSTQVPVGSDQLHEDLQEGKFRIWRKLMVKTIEAMFDGSAFRPVEPIELEANTRVRLIVETVPLTTDEPASFLQTARSLNLDGPADWSANLDKYLYGEEIEEEDGGETESAEKRSVS